jgi:hypothetical protein
MIRRAITQRDLTLFTINTGEFYQLHCLMARKNCSVDGWRDWLRDRVLPLYAKQVEPVTYDYDTLINSAREVRDYYANHVTEMREIEECICGRISPPFHCPIHGQIGGI